MSEEELEQQEPELGQEEQEYDDSWRSASSSMVEGWAYNREAQEIEISFNNGHSASYPCSPQQWEEAKLASSPGRFVHANFL